MKRLFALIMALSMSCYVCLPAQAQYSFQEDTSVEAASESTTGSEKTAGDEVSSEAENTGRAEEENTAASDVGGETGGEEGSTDDNAEASAAAYGIEDLKGAPDITADSAILMDAASGAVLYGKDENSKQYPASITKVMTALLAIENCSMDDIVTFSNEAVNGIEPGSSSAGINVGAQLTVRENFFHIYVNS